MFDLYILGAGFSVMSGAPKAKEILPEISRSAINTTLFQVIEQILFPGDPQWFNSNSFNAVLSRLDLIKYYKPYQNLDYKLVEWAENQLLSQMILTLQPSKTNGNQELYLNFVSQNKNSSYLTFNYDLVLEQALDKAGLPISRGLPINNLKHPHFPDGIDGNRFVLKLHGSIDLVYCPCCGGIFTNNFITAEKVLCPLCPQEQTFLKHFLVAPTLYKTYRLPAIRDLWYRALQLLLKSKKICFIGYSLPDGDMLAFQLLDTAYRLTGGNQVVHLVNGPNYNPAKLMEIYGDNLINTRRYFQDWF